MLSIIMPAHNEAGRIAITLEDYIAYFIREYHQDFEMVVVADGCTDQTAAIVDKYSRQFPQIRSVTLKRKLGKGKAINEGFKIANGGIIVLIDADGATPPQELSKLILELRDNDGAIGSRWLPESNIVTKQSWARRIASRGFNLLVRILFVFPFKDTQCGAKAFRKQSVDGVMNQLETAGYSFDVELLYRLKKKGCKIKEVPITWEEKGGSHLSLIRIIPRMFLAVIKVRLLDSPFRCLIKSHSGDSLRDRGNENPLF